MLPRNAPSCRCGSTRSSRTVTGGVVFLSTPADEVAELVESQRLFGEDVRTQGYPVELHPRRRPLTQYRLRATLMGVGEGADLPEDLVMNWHRHHRELPKIAKSGPAGPDRLRSRRYPVRVLVAFLAATASCLTGVAPSEAAVAHASDFSPYVAIATYSGPAAPTVPQDCFVKVGAAFDNWHASPDYHFFGIASISCSVDHQIVMTLREYRDVDGVVQEVGAPGAYAAYTKWLQVITGPACRDGYAAPGFYASAYITVDGQPTGWLSGFDVAAAAGEGCG
jgi:hypothetical protein